MKIILVIGLVLALVLAGCASSTPNKQPAQKQPYTCPDGTVVTNTSNCPPIYTCPDGIMVTDISSCSKSPVPSASPEISNKIEPKITVMNNIVECHGGNPSRGFDTLTKLKIESGDVDFTGENHATFDLILYKDSQEVDSVLSTLAIGAYGLQPGGIATGQVGGDFTPGCGSNYSLVINLRRGVDRTVYATTKIEFMVDNISNNRLAVQQPAQQQTYICSDGTIDGVCSITKPKFCDRGVLIDKASKCGCISNYDISGESCIQHIDTATNTQASANTPEERCYAAAEKCTAAYFRDTYLGACAQLAYVGLDTQIEKYILLIEKKCP